jgi:hypothetical protein
MSTIGANAPHDGVFQIRMKLVSALALALMGCSGAVTSEERIEKLEHQLIGEQATGSVPSGLPARFMLGLNEGRGGSWMSGSGVPWDMRYQYLSKNWVNNWGHGDADGQYALDFFYDTYERNMLPAVQFYQIVEEQPPGEDTMLQKLGDPATMKSYFGDFKLLMERVKDYGGPVVVMVEADGYGFAQIQSGDDPTHYAAIADSGLPELGGLPNTVAGWGLAYLQLKQAVGADNALLGVHVSAWATNYDVMMNNDHVDLQTEVDVAYWFLSQLGLTENQTGLTYDFLVGDPADRDAGYYEKVLGQQRWWDADDAASIESRSFNRFAEWMRLWNVKSGKRWILWQLPLGNSNHLDVDNTGGSRQGYRDNRPEYFLANGTAHIQKFADAGTIALLFGAGMQGMSTFDNDFYTDGQLFMKSRAGAIYEQGDLGITTGQEWTPSETMPRPRPVSPSSPPANVDIDGTIPTQFEWESDRSTALQGWSYSGPLLSGLEVTNEQAFQGAGSLGLRLSTGSEKTRVMLKDPKIEPGTPYAIFRLYVPAGHALTEIIPYVQQAANTDYAWISSWYNAAELESDAWNTLFVRIPGDAVMPITELGLEFSGAAGEATTFYLDSVGWPADGGATQEPTGGTSAGGMSEQPNMQKQAGCAIAAPTSSSTRGLALIGLALVLLRRRRSAGRAAA